METANFARKAFERWSRQQARSGNPVEQFRQITKQSETKLRRAGVPSTDDVTKTVLRKGMRPFKPAKLLKGIR